MIRAPRTRTWFVEEIEAVLASVDDANRDVADAIDTPEMALYRRGFDAALRSVALAFQVDAPSRSVRTEVMR